VSGRLEAGSTSNLWFRDSQGLRVEIELPQGPDLSAISDIAMFYCGLPETVLRLRVVRTHGRNPRVRLPQAPSPLCIQGRARSDTRAGDKRSQFATWRTDIQTKPQLDTPWSGSLRFARDDARPPPPRGPSRRSIRSRKSCAAREGSATKRSRLEMAPQRLEKIESAPGNGMGSEASNPLDLVRGRAADRARLRPTSRNDEVAEKG
jgi:hypothetical protein